MVKREVSPDRNKNRKESPADAVDMDTNDDYDADAAEAKANAKADTASNAKNCLLDHGVGAIYNMRRFNNGIQFEVECDVCDRIEWQPVDIVKRHYPQKVIDFYEGCIEWKSQ